MRAGRGGLREGQEVNGRINRFAGLIYSGSVSEEEMESVLPSATKANKG